ncbi:MAG TPA: DUF6790 family protein [Caulobacteraceae bacterium]
MYLAIVALTMFVLPLGSMAAEHSLRPDASLIWLAGKWFVFWGVGVRLALAGARQVLQPAFTAREIFHMESSDALPLVRELGVANLATGIVGLSSLLAPSFVLPVAISAGIFYGVAGARHAAERGRSRNETIAMASDLFIFAVLAAFVGASVLNLR